MQPWACLLHDLPTKETKAIVTRRGSCLSHLLSEVWQGASYSTLRRASLIGPCLELNVTLNISWECRQLHVYQRSRVDHIVALIWWWRFLSQCKTGEGKDILPNVVCFYRNSYGLIERKWIIVWQLLYVDLWWISFLPRRLRQGFGDCGFSRMWLGFLKWLKKTIAKVEPTNIWCC